MGAMTFENMSNMVYKELMERIDARMRSIAKDNGKEESARRLMDSIGG